MKPFIEDFADAAHGDPLDDKRSTDFDYDEVDRRLGAVTRNLPEDGRQDVAFAMSELLRWVIEGLNLDAPLFENHLAQRVLALLWTVSPGYIEGSPSLSKIAKRLGTHKSTLSAHAAEASRTFGVRNRGQSHGWNFKKQKTMTTNINNLAANLIEAEPELARHYSVEQIQEQLQVLANRLLIAALAARQGEDC